ncbi:AAA family ATPase [Corynebacterium halotolerans]|uniref:DNA repair ATPase n=1 Tax=Corynebacterium halotolerans YIM 70093 = DSM 44683 TaxID=1121362 RepID=M1NRR2_9CORY|nr:AAA family ATPase [Corynebacterium halotolerans]AGF72197.1 DNA repair ATPase [Corynebacterium halotolerans YIM 70093 = DSM 44683]
MRIHSLTIDNVRGIEHLELTDLPQTGVIVISGDNEQGKSTILDALHAVLNEKHSSKKKTLRELQPVDRDAAPSVTLTATLGPHTFTLAKTWLRRAKAELTITAPARENHTGDEAEEKLDRLKADFLDDGLLRALFLRQGDIDTAGDATGIPSLTRALDGAEDTGAASGTEDSALMKAVEAEYTRYYTAGKGAEAGVLKTARTQHAEARASLADARAAVAELEGFVTRVETVTRDRDEATAQLPDARAEVTALGEKAEQAAAAQEKADRLRGDLTRAEDTLTRARAAVAAREQQKTGVTELAEALAERSRGLAEAQEKAAQEDQQLTTLGEQLDEARAQEDAAREALKRARARHRLLTDLARRDELAARLADIDALDERIRGLREQSAGPRVTDEDLRAVEDAATELTLQRRLREAAAAKLRLSAAETTSVTVDDADVEIRADEHVVELREGTTLTIGAVTAVYSAGHTGTTPATDAVAAAERALADLLEDLGCADVEAARTARETARRVDEDLAGLTRERAGLVRGDDVDALRAELSRLSGELTEVEADNGVDGDGDPERAAAAVEEATDALEEATGRVSKVDAALVPWRERQAATALTRLSTQVEGDQLAADRARRALEAAEEENPEEGLHRQVDSAEAAVEEAAARVAEAEQSLAREDPELATKMWEGAREHLSSLEKTVAEAERKLAELTGRIEQATGAAEELEKATAAEEAAANRLASVERRAQAARLLRDTLQEHRARARRRYAQPFAEQLTVLARTVFGPDVEFTLTDSLDVEARSIGDRSVPLESLSGGAREQLAILTRFAIARLVSKEGVDGAGGTVPVPVVVDDALGSTDPSRLQLMATLFSDMGRTGQVVVLTCVPQRYSRVTGRTEYPIEELKAAGRLL